MSDTAAAQLRRILALVPELADDREHTLDALAGRLRTSVGVLLRDLHALTERFDDPGGFVEEGVAVYVEGDTVSLTSPHFRRPMRLTAGELRALELGLLLLERERPPDETAAARRARERVRRLATRVPPDDDPERRDGELAAPGSVDDLAVLRQAVRERRKVRLGYRRATDVDATERVVAPYALVVARGAWYAVAFCERSAGVRVFRLDRVTGVSLLDASYAVPSDFSLDDLVRDGRVFRAAEPRTLTVRYSARVAGWIAERERGVRGEDGSYTVEHPLADDEWAVRHVLQYGADAEVIAPREVRDLVRERVRRMLECAP